MTTLGCGKEITEAQTPNSRIIQNQDLPSALVIKLETQVSSDEVYEIPRNGNIMLPEKLWVRSGSGAGKTVEIIYNLEESAEGNFDYKCTYKSISSSKEIPLDNCVSGRGTILNDATSFEFPIYYGKAIKMEMQSATAGLTVDAIYTVDWK
jgi:hypothetical protein